MNFRTVHLAALLALLLSALIVLPAGAQALAAAPTVPAASVYGVTAVGAGSSHTCVVNADKTVSCWGNNSYGQLGDGTTTNRDLPTTVPGLTGVKQLALGGAHTCALTDDGAVWCWGNSSNGQIGDGSKTNRLSPVQVPALPFGVGAITAGAGHTCAARSTDNSVRCWGLNKNGQLGDNTTTDRSTPTFVSGMANNTFVSRLTAGEEFTCALLQGGAVKCWGRNHRAQLGDGTQVDRRVPVNTAISGVADLDAGRLHVCAALGDGSVRCWGDNESGQIGDTGALAFSEVPVVIPGIANATQVDANGFSSCARQGNGVVQCWGDNQAGQLGDGTTISRKTAAPVSGISGATQISGGSVHFCAIVSGGALRCWGDNSSGQLADGTLLYRAVRSDVPGLGNVSTLAGGFGHTCALMANGTVQCWGSNVYGQLGDGTKTDRPTASVVPGLSGVTKLAVGGGHTCALLSDKTVRCWGYNNDGQLGDGTIVSKSSPVQVQELGAALDIVAGYQHTCALTSVLGVKCWGHNQYGQLGDGTTFQSNKPRDVAGLNVGANAIAAGGYHTCAVTSANGVKCWGNNSNGQLGNNTDDTSVTPVDTSGVSNAIAVVAGGAHSCAQLGDGTAKCWGNNEKGQLGDTTTEQRLTPVAVFDLGGIQKMAAGGPHTCAITSGGTLWCWGNGGSGELGDWRQEDRKSPQVVQGAASGASLIGLGQSHTCVELESQFFGQAVSCFGWDGSGQLGLGTVTRRLAPVAAQATMPATLSVNYGSGKPGSEFVLSGYRFAQGEVLSFTINGTPVTPALTPAQAAAGSFTLDLLTAEGNAPGIYTVQATSASRQATVSVRLGGSYAKRVDPGSSVSISTAGIAPVAAKDVYLPIQLR
jgi:alpha-tubulin suppressor-like RCC1 family protein